MVIKANLRILYYFIVGTGVVLTVDDYVNYVLSLDIQRNIMNALHFCVNNT